LVNIFDSTKFTTILGKNNFYLMRFNYRKFFRTVKRQFSIAEDQGFAEPDLFEFESSYDSDDEP